mgnify:FL=1
MLETLAATLVTLGAVYALVGVVFALIFVWRGVGVIDPAAREGTWGFRLLILPGCVAFWPLLLGRWRRRQPPPEERNAHRDLAREAAPTDGGAAGGAT